MSARRRCRLAVVDDAEMRVRLPRARLQRVLDAALAEAGIDDADLTVLIVGAARSAELHGAHFADPTPTDVMTFPDGGTDPATGRIRLGDLAVCADVASREGKSRGRAAGDELTLYVLHGLLHLIGYDDRKVRDRRRMWDAQRRLLAAVGIAIEAEPG